MLPHDLTIAVSGGLILWSAGTESIQAARSRHGLVGIGRVATNTTLAACAADSPHPYGYMMTKKWDAGYTTNGFSPDWSQYLPCMMPQSRERGTAPVWDRCCR